MYWAYVYISVAYVDGSVGDGNSQLTRDSFIVFSISSAMQVLKVALEYIGVWFGSGGPQFQEERRHAFKAISEGDLNQLKENPLLQADSKVQGSREKFKNLKTYQNNTMLIFAVEYGHMDLI